MGERDGIFAGDNPFDLARAWLGEAEKSEPNDPNAMALSTVDSAGLPNVRMVLLKAIEEDGFVFYTNYGSAKGQELDANPMAAVVLHWKSLRRQLRLRGAITRVEGEQADAYFASRPLKSRLGAITSDQSRPLSSRAAFMAKLAKITATYGTNPARPDTWGGFKIVPMEIEFWADGAHRLHDRFVWRRENPEKNWQITRLYP